MNLMFIRKKNIMFRVSEDGNIVPDTANRFISVNAAKRESRRIQLANGGLGNGAVKVEK